MEEHFLKEIVVGQAKQKPEPWYNPDGDCIIFQMEDEAMVANRIDEVLTVYDSLETGRTIGYQIKGVAALAKRFGWGGVLVEHMKQNDEIREISLSALLLAAYEEGPKTIGRRRAYAGLFESSVPRSRMRADDLETLFP